MASKWFIVERNAWKQNVEDNTLNAGKQSIDLRKKNFKENIGSVFEH